MIPSFALFDVGGVVLSNAWSRTERAQAAQRFGLDDGFEARHAPLAAAMERGEIGLEEYLSGAVFDRPRGFTREAFREFIYSCSRPLPDSLALVEELARGGRVRLATLNNEGRDLNLYRIERFGLGGLFQAFCTSCYLGARKPEAAIYERALGVLHARPEECVFVDDREGNVEAARKLGLDAIQFRGAAQLREELAARGLLPARG